MNVQEKSQNAPNVKRYDESYNSEPKYTACSHCGQPSLLKYCCLGCETASRFITECKLDDYYRLKGAEVLSPSASAQKPDVSYLDIPGLREPYLVAPDTIEFYIQGLQCSACVWLIEKIPSISGFPLRVSVDGSRNIVQVTVFEGGKFTQFMELAYKLGFSLRPLQNTDSLIDLRRSEARQELWRLAVTFFAMGNIMLFSFAVYFGAEAPVARFLSWLSTALFIPVMFYGARPLWVMAWSSMKLKRASVELPILIALFSGFVLSLRNQLLGLSDVYFDSMSALVFLLLAGRFLVRRMEDRFYEHQSASSKMDIPFARLAGSTQYSPASSLKDGDLIEIHEGEKISADARVQIGEGWVDQSMLTGESMPQRLLQGSEIFAGTTLVSGSVKAQVIRPLSQARLSQLQKTACTMAMAKGRVHAHLEEWSERFTIVVLTIGAVITGYGLYIGQFDYLYRALALFIVACPCAIALAAPLIYSIALDRLSRSEIYLNSVDVFTKIKKIKNAAFDKTGTLTTGQLQVVDIEGELSPQDHAIILALESNQLHPVARAFLRHFSSAPTLLPKVTEFKVEPGHGVRANIDGHVYSLKKSRSHLPQEPGQFKIWVDYRRDQQLVCQISLADRLRPESHGLIKNLRRMGIQSWIFSGDRKSNVRSVAYLLGIDEANTSGDETPESKLSKILNLQGVMMVGDGFNDSAALAAADLGVVVGGGLENTNKVGDVFLGPKGLSHLTSLWQESSLIERSIHRVKWFSIVYNLGSGTLALLGLANPLVAAVLMPLASVILVVISKSSMASQVKGGQWK